MAILAPCGLATLLGLASPALADACRLALVLALDVSDSVDPQEDRLQRGGLAQVLVAPEVVRAFLGGEPVALYVFEWASSSFQVGLTPGWQMVRSEEDLARIAAAIRARPGRGETVRTTAIGVALRHAAVVLSHGPECAARKVDVSGDGRNNDGVPLEVAYRDPLFDGVTVNALVIGGPQDDYELVTWFEAEVLHGPGAFWILADGYEDYERAMAAKLLRELEMPLVSLGPDGAVLASGS